MDCEQLFEATTRELRLEYTQKIIKKGFKVKRSNTQEIKGITKARSRKTNMGGANKVNDTLDHHDDHIVSKVRNHLVT